MEVFDESGNSIAVVTKEEQSPAIISNGKVTIRYGSAVPAEKVSKDKDSEKEKLEPLPAAGQELLKTWSKQSPAIQAKGDVEVLYD